MLGRGSFCQSLLSLHLCLGHSGLVPTHGASFLFYVTIQPHHCCVNIMTDESVAVSARVVGSVLPELRAARQLRVYCYDRAFVQPVN